MTTRTRIGLFLTGLGIWTLGWMSVGMVWVGKDTSLDAANFWGIGFFSLIGLVCMLSAVLVSRIKE